MKKFATLVVVAACIFEAFAPAAFAESPAPAAVSAVIISEIKLGGDSYSHGTDQPKDPQEFIALYNQSANAVDLTNWALEYAKSTFDPTYCSAGSWMAHSVSGSASQTLLSGTLQPGQVSTPIVRSLTDNTAGSLHLVNNSDPNNIVVEDLMGWGTSAPCAGTTTATTPSNGKSLKRYLDCNNLPIDTNNNSLDFATNQPPSPGVLSSPYLTNCQDSSTTDTAAPQQTCEGVVISELLPNPSGSDSGNEFIELYNPTPVAISLQGCSMQTSASSKVYNFENSSLQPGQYLAFYSDTTGLTLPNAAGGTAWLLSPSAEIQAVTYPGNIDDNVSWALVNGSWQATYQPTPNAANVLASLKPCEAGETRNPNTGYCNSVATLTTSPSTICKPGQEINPATGRCKAIASTASSALTPCGPGQERNPATNRCKAIVTTASATLKPCPAGQERNPTTNRCRKVTSTSAVGKLTGSKGAVADSIASSPHWWIAGIALTGATGYGVYEWRRECGEVLRKIKTKLPGFSG